MRKFNLWVQLQQSENISISTFRVKMSKHNFLRLEFTKKKSSDFQKKELDLLPTYFDFSNYTLY